MPNFVNDHPLPNGMPEALSSFQRFELVADVFRSVSSPARVQIIQSLLDQEKTVLQLTDELASSQSNVSQHLALLYRSGVLGVRRQGPHRYYRVIDPLVVEVCHLVDYAVTAAARQEQTGFIRWQTRAMQARI